MSTRTQLRLYAAAEAAIKRSTDPTRHKCFVGYHEADADEVEAFIDEYGHVFIPRVLGVSDDDPFIDSTDTDYVMDEIREKYLTDSTVTIVLMGKCTWARRYVDWEVYSSLRNDKNNRRNGVLAIQLKSQAETGCTLQARINDNVRRENGVNVGYARWNVYPTSEATLRSWIEDAFTARTTRADLIDNTRARRKSNAECS